MHSTEGTGTAERTPQDTRRPPLITMLWPGSHAPLVSARRAAIILARVRLVSWIFGLLVPLFIVLDLLLLPWELAESIVYARVLASGALIGIALGFRHHWTMASARLALGCLLVVPTTFFIYAEAMLGGMPQWNAAQALISIYTMFPLAIVAGIAVFPVTAFEGVVLALPVIATKLAAMILTSSAPDVAQIISSLWLFALVAGISVLAAACHLQLMLQLLVTTARDRLSDAFTRRVGEELLDLNFSQAQRENKPMTVVVLDLDDFKAVNDDDGHEAGDAVLQTVGRTLIRGCRSGDAVVRWGGDEFLLLLPNTKTAGAARVINRIRAAGLAERPDGRTQTASVGIAERLGDGAGDWRTLVRMADARAYAAKRGGKDRIVVSGRGEAQVAA